MYNLSSTFEVLWNEAMQSNITNIVSLLEKNTKANVLDVGCGDGLLTRKFMKKIDSKKITGLEGDRERIIQAKHNGIKKIIYADLEKNWPLINTSFDVIISNQVIEHIVDIDHFIEEIYRLLRPGGYCVISTENLASWHNIGALILGFQDFSHDLISKSHVGNPISIHFGEKTGGWKDKLKYVSDQVIYPHVKIPTYISLISIFSAYSFRFIKGKGSGYYPFFGNIGKILSSFDPYHSHFITIKIVK